MNDDQYLEHCRQLLAEFARDLVVRTQHLPEDDSLRELATAFSLLAASTDNLYTLGPELITRLFTTHTEFAPTLPRELLWFFGGDCLHYMPDEEIAIYQQLEDMRLQAARRGETFKLREARAKLLNLQ